MIIAVCPTNTTTTSTATTTTLYATSSGPDGPAFTNFLVTLNDRCRDDVTVDCTTHGEADCVAGPGGPCGFAGHRDWRLPAEDSCNARYSGGSCTGSAGGTN